MGTKSVYKLFSTCHIIVHTKMDISQWGFSTFVIYWPLFSNSCFSYFIIFLWNYPEYVDGYKDTLIPLVQKYEYNNVVQVRRYPIWMETEGMLFFSDFTKLLMKLFLMTNIEKKLDVAGIPWFFLMINLINHLISKTLSTCILFNNL